jgi:glycosidase
MTGASDPDNRRMMRFGNELSEAEQKKLSDVSTIINTRRNHPALRYGDFLTLAAEGNLYAYIRSDMNERILILLNKGREAAKISLDLPVIYKIEKGKDILSGEEFKIVNGKLELEIKGTGWRFVEIK